MGADISIPASDIIRKFRQHKPGSAFTVAISGIDAAGKGYISKLLQTALKEQGFHTALIHIDPWQNPLPVRLVKENAAQNVYENIVRWDDLFDQLILPLKKNWHIYLETKGIRTDADIYYPLTYDLRNIDILLVEGIFLLKQELLSCYDFRIWIECSFKIRLQRAISRNAENLDPGALLHDYHTFYFPAQRHHFEKR